MRINWAAEWPDINVKAINWDGMSNVDFIDNWRSMPAMAKIGMSQGQTAKNIKRYISIMGPMSIQPESRHSQPWQKPDKPAQQTTKLSIKDRIQLVKDHANPQPVIDDKYYCGPMRDFPHVEPKPAYCGEWLRGSTYNLVHSKTGAGKTLVLAELCYAIKTGADWLGMKTRDVGSIMYINGEMPDVQVSQRMKYLEEVGVHVWHCEFAKMMEENMLNRFLEICRDFSMVIVDNRSSLFQMQEGNKEESWQEINELMRSIPNQYGTVLIMATHEGKGEATGAFGSSAQEWFCDNVIRISHIPEDRAINHEDDYKATFERSDMTYVRPIRKLEFTKNRLCREIPSRLLNYIGTVTSKGNARTVIDWDKYVIDPLYIQPKKINMKKTDQKLEIRDFL